MRFLPSIRLVKKAFEEGYAVPSFCVWNAEMADTVLRVASECRAPVMLMSGPGEFLLLPPEKQAATARAVAAFHSVPAALHLDHGRSLESVRSCLDAGYTSVMLDYSRRPFEENVAALRQVVEMARPLGASVEGEIGAVGMADEVTTEGARGSTLTDPEEAKAYVEQTGIDMVAVSIGNAHGNYRVLPELDFELLATLREATGIPLVLHGGSGTPEQDLRKAISLGIAKVNVATELISAVRQTLLELWNAGDTLWLPVASARAMAQVALVVEKWIRLTGAAGQA